MTATVARKLKMATVSLRIPFFFPFSIARILAGLETDEDEVDEEAQEYMEKLAKSVS